jgi:hypothetical protein
MLEDACGNAAMKKTHAYDCQESFCDGRAADVHQLQQMTKT